MMMMKTASFEFCAEAADGASPRGGCPFCAAAFGGLFLWAFWLFCVQFQTMRDREATIFTRRKIGLKPPMKNRPLPTLKFITPGKTPLKKSKKRFPIRPCLYSITGRNNITPYALIPQSGPMDVLGYFRIPEGPFPHLQRRRSELPSPSSRDIYTLGSHLFPGPTTTIHSQKELFTTTRHFQLRIITSNNNAPKQMTTWSNYWIRRRFVANTTRKGLGTACLSVLL